MKDQIIVYKKTFAGNGILKSEEKNRLEYHSVQGGGINMPLKLYYVYWLLSLMLVCAAHLPARSADHYIKTARRLSINPAPLPGPHNNVVVLGTPYLSQIRITQMLRFKLVLDSFNYDDIAIGFSPLASTKYNLNEDSEYLPGIDATEGLSSFSSDGMRLSINILPLPKLQPLLIKLDVESRFTTTYTLERTELSNMPPIYEFWLIDKYKKDSLDIRANANYTFQVDISDTASYGVDRFSVIIRQNPALGVHLLDFGAFKATGGVQISWLTENEQTYTHFTAERSVDNGATFRALEGAMSTGAANYSHFDNAPSAVIDLYRLKITDLNGAITYSNTVSVNLGNASGLTGGGIRVYPNPSYGAINLAIVPAIAGASFPNSSIANGSAAKLNSSPCYGIRIINVTGRVIRTAICLQPNWQDDFTGFPAGTYVVQVLNNDDNTLVGKATFVKL